MKPHVVLLAVMSAVSLMALAKPSLPLDPAWHLAGESRNYEAGVADFGYARGSHAKYLRADKVEGMGWGTLMQSFGAEQYRGKRLRFQAQVRTEGITGWSGLWMRVDCEGKYSCAFYNSEDKPIRGTQDWQLRSVTLDVPDNAKSISFGVIAGGKGTVWIDDLKMEAVGNDVATNALPSREDVVQQRTKPSL